jgi:very-short-patch-repair endonuclease
MQIPPEHGTDSNSNQPAANPAVQSQQSAQSSPHQTDQSGESHPPALSAVLVGVTIDIVHSDRVNFAMQQHGVPLVHQITITNNSTEPLEDLTLSIRMVNGECEPFATRISRIEADEQYTLAPSGLALRAKELASRTEAERTQLEAALTCGQQTMTRSWDVDVLAFDQWPGIGHLPEIIAAFVTPNHPRVAELLSAARTALAGLSETDSLDGYQSGSRQRVSLIAEACFNSLAARRIGYINPPASFEHTGQRIRLVDRVCREGFGTCLDLSVLLASMLEQCGLHPLILLPEGHAMPAVWTHSAQLPEAALDDPSRIRNLIELGEIIPLESTLLTSTNSSFAGAVDAAKHKMDHPGDTFCAVDIRAARKRGVRPLPLRSEGDSTAIELEHIINTAPATSLDRVMLADRAAQREQQQATTSSVETVDAESGDDRVRRWQTRLLDLSLRNRLINFKETGKTIRLLVPDVAQLENLLASEARCQIVPKSVTDADYLKQELAANRIYTDQTDTETLKRLLGLYRTAKASIEETGANLLHLAIGTLKWYETSMSQQPRHAPLLLIPVKLLRHSGAGGYRYELAMSDEPVRPNITLLEKLRNEFGVATSGLEELPEDEQGLDVPLILRNFREAIRDIPRWEVAETAWLGLFSFNKFLMWRDLQEQMVQLKANRLVRHLVDRNASAFDPEPLPNPADLDASLSPNDLICTRDADSSQLAAVRAASLQRTFVLEGPPGTGKSQTIANIIADSLARGKRVLFVAEKMAALSVVRHRLEQDGLGAYCLELHSAKATKKEVLAQLQVSLQISDAAMPAEWDSSIGTYTHARDQLNTYVQQLHTRRPSGETLYQVMGRLALLADGPRCSPAHDTIEHVTTDQLSQWRSKLSHLCESARPVDPVYQHPLRGIGKQSFSFGLTQQAATLLNNASAALSGLHTSVDTLCRIVAPQIAVSSMTEQTIKFLATLAEQLQVCPTPDARLLSGRDAPALRKRVQDFATVGSQRDQIRDRLLERYHTEFLTIDALEHLATIQRAIATPPLLRFFVAYPLRKSLRKYCKATLPPLEQLSRDLEAVREHRTLSERLRADTQASSLLGSTWTDGQTSPNDWARIKSMLDWCDTFAQTADALLPAVDGSSLREALCTLAADRDQLNAAQPELAALLDAWSRWTQTFTEAARELEISAHTALPAEPAEGWLADMHESLRRMLLGLDDLNEWCAWQKARNQAIDAGLEQAVQQYEIAQITLDTLPSAFERGYGESWFLATANKSDAIRGFNEPSHLQTVQRFTTADRKLIELSRRVVAARLGKVVPDAAITVSANSELGILRRQLEKKRNHLPTRRLIEAMPNLLPKLKPCFLMSPLSIAQYLDARLPAFDLVIFDEASQIPVWDSIGAVARGREVIVVGDSKQLPPTTFFSTIDDEQEEFLEDTSLEDMESILQECNASGVPPMRLQWHYRSRHESLIAFSNHHYYNNELHTFPSPDDRSDRLGVTSRYVPTGVYDRGNTRTNRIEAEHVADEVVRLLTGPHAHESIGVVTFNQAQQVLLEDMLDDKRREFPQIEKYFTAEVDEPLFVKNLESVQGDERDTIIFSVGYGPDSTGRPSMNFGPLNQEGGERRLNVAVTRARRKLMVFTSLRSDQIDLRRTQSLGVRHFKQFLDYADRGAAALVNTSDNAARNSAALRPEAGLEEALYLALTARGHALDRNVGYAGYRIDLAVRDPHKPGRYLLGIECDGRTYAKAATARDRDRTRRSVLLGLGWNLHRVWSVQWRLNPAKCLFAIEQAIETVRSAQETSQPDQQPPSAPATLLHINDPTGTPVPELPTKTAAASSEHSDSFRDDQLLPNADPSQSINNIAQNARESRPEPPRQANAAAPSHPFTTPAAQPTQEVGVYTAAKPPVRGLQKKDIFDPANTLHALDCIAAIVAVEGPISEELTLRRLASWFGVTRITDRFRQHWTDLCEQFVQQHNGHFADGVFWPARVNPEHYTSYRVHGDAPESQRDIELIPIHDLENLLVAVTRQQFGLPREDLFKEASRILGLSRITDRVHEHLELAFLQAIRRGRLSSSGDSVTVLST